MKIKRYTAVSMRAALAQVRAEQGPDAVILSTCRAAEGIEVVAAVDYDESLMAASGRQRGAAAPAADATAVANGVASAAAAAPAAVKAAPDPGLAHLRRELHDMRALLQSELASLSWRDGRLREPLRARVLDGLLELDVAADVAKALAALAPRHSSLGNPAHIPLALLVRHLPLVEDRSCEVGGVVAVVGPTGVGKTTTIAKLAARWSLRHGSADLALVSTDGQRIGAREQLQTYARILGVPMLAANGGEQLAGALHGLRHKRLVLIDTAGVGPRDARLSEQLAALRFGAAGARVLLALPAQAEERALQQIAAAFGRLRPAACILTKIDEAASLGAAMSAAIRNRLPIAYLCNGQRVPDDLHSAHQRGVWLVRSAQKIKERSRPPAASAQPRTGAVRRGNAHAQ